MLPDRLNCPVAAAKRQDNEKDTHYSGSHGDMGNILL
jgi:hypothetical protein